jgi:hypothetical protein
MAASCRRHQVRSGEREELEEKGFVVFDGVLDRSMRDRLAAVADAVVAAQGPDHATSQQTTGSMVPVTSHPAYAELIALPAARDVLVSLGFADATFSDGWVISKPGGAPRLFWHYDWFAWEDPASYQRTPLQVALMYYLDDTCRANGCLRVVPGSHNRHNDLHDLLSVPRPALTAGEVSDVAEFGDRPDEVDVPIRAGELLVTDARLLHASHPNTTRERRRLVTLWYQPALSTLPERIQAQMARKAQQVPDWWPAEARQRVNDIRTTYDGNAEPYPRTLYRRRVQATGSNEGVAR